MRRWEWMTDIASRARDVVGWKWPIEFTPWTCNTANVRHTWKHHSTIDYTWLRTLLVKFPRIFPGIFTSGLVASRLGPGFPFGNTAYLFDSVGLVVPFFAVFRLVYVLGAAFVSNRFFSSSFNRFRTLISYIITAKFWWVITIPFLKSCTSCLSHFGL